MVKPKYRDSDEHPSRSSDISVPVPWSDRPVTASGPVVVQILMWAAVISAGVWHHDQTQKEFIVNREVAMLQASYSAQQVCVSRLTEVQKEEDRKMGSYCPDPFYEIKRYISIKDEKRR